LTRQPSASAARSASVTARREGTGSAPGSARQTGQTSVFGCAPKRFAQPQNSFVRVSSCACTSRPITGS
jgi:hypothetical protein